MTTYTFDTDDIIQRLRRAGLTEEQAREFVQAIRIAQTELATKADLRELGQELKWWTGKALVAAVVLIISAMAALKVFG